MAAISNRQFMAQDVGKKTKKVYDFCLKIVLMYCFTSMMVFAQLR